MQDSKKIAIIGSPDTALPFQAIGADSYHADTAERAENLLDEVILKSYGIIYIEEAYARVFNDKIARLNNAYHRVAVTVIPGSKGGEDLAVKKLGRLVKKAIGMDIFADKGGN